MYQFNWRLRAMDGALGATHSLEIPFAFDNLDQAGVDFFLGPGPTPQAVADTMHKVWSDFIKTGEPGWPRYDLTTRATMLFDDESILVEDPDPEGAWRGTVFAKQAVIASAKTRLTQDQWRVARGGAPWW